MTVTVRQLSQAIANENLPVAITNPTELAIYNAGPTAWWSNNQATMKGVITSSPFTWQDRVSLTPLTAAISGTQPIPSTDSISGIPYLAMGYGGSLAQTNFTLAQILIHLGGTGYVTGDTGTDANGTVFNLTASAGAVTGATVRTLGTYSSYPSNPVSFVSTSGAGTGCALDLDFESPNGGVITAAGSTLLPTSGPLSFVAAFRCPVVGGVAGATPGGVLLGNALSQSKFADVAANIRLTGLGVGYGPGGNAGKLVFRVSGDARICFPSAAQDLRDGNWHVGIGGMTPSAGAANLCLDTGQIATLSIPTNTTINSTPGAQMIRVGDAGLPTSLPVFGWSGDIGDMMVWPIDLTASANTATRQLVGNYLNAKYGVSGTWS